MNSNQLITVLAIDSEGIERLTLVNLQHVLTIQTVDDTSMMTMIDGSRTQLLCRVSQIMEENDRNGTTIGPAFGAYLDEVVQRRKESKNKDQDRTE